MQKVSRTMGQLLLFQLLLLELSHDIQETNITKSPRLDLSWTSVFRFLLWKVITILYNAVAGMIRGTLSEKIISRFRV